MAYRILFSNIGYAKGIDGSLKQHIRHLHRHIHCPVPVQQQALMQLKTILDDHQPDLCCFVEVEHDLRDMARFSHLREFIDGEYPHHDVADKYGPNNWLSNMPWHKGRCNAFLSRDPVTFERRYFSFGSKRLIYEIDGPGGTAIFFAHFSLQRKVRAEQFREMRRLIARKGRPAIVLADFNIMGGFQELAPLVEENDLRVISREDEPTFLFYKYKMTLDLCIASESLQDRISVRIIPQSFSDHDALLVDIDI